MKSRWLGIISFNIIFFMCLLPPPRGWAEKSPVVDIHGYLSQGFLVSSRNNYLADTTKGTFQFNELGINFSTDLTDKLRLGIQLAARDLGDSGNDKIRIDWAYADYRWQDWLGLRIGKIKLPLGLYNKTRDIDMLRTFILLPQGIYNEAYRDTSIAMKGMSCYGEITLKSIGDFSYQVLFGTMDIAKDSSTTKAIENRGELIVEKHNVTNLFCGAITWDTPLQGLRLGACIESFALIIDTVLAQDYSISLPSPPYSITVARQGDAMILNSPGILQLFFSLEYTWRDLVVAAEYFRMDQKFTVNVQGQEIHRSDSKFDSFYVSACYRFCNFFEAGGYYSVFYKNRNDRDGTATPYDPVYNAFQKDACLSFRFDLNDHWTVKLEGHRMEGTALCSIVDNLNEKGAPETHKNWFLAAAKITFAF